MPVSPTDFSLWARLTGNKYPSNAEEKARIAPDVHRFIQNMDKQGAVGVSNPKEKENKDSLGKKIAKGALVAGGIAAGIAAAKNKRVQDIAQRAASTTRNKIDDFLVNLGRAQDVDIDIVDASGDVTPDPSVQQSNVAPQQDLREPTVIDAEQVLNDARKIVNRETSIDVTPDPRQQQSNVAPQLKSGPESIKPGGLGSRIVGPLPDVSIEDSVDFDIARSPDDPTYGAYGEDVQLGNVKDIMREQEQLAAFTGETSPGIDPVSGVSYEDIKQKLQNTAAARGVKPPSLIERVEQKKAELKNSFKPAVGGKTFQTSGAVGSEDVYGDIGDAKLRARRTFGPTIDAIKEMNPDRNVSRMGRQMLDQAQKDRDFDISYITARNSGMSDADAVQVARETAGFNPDAPVGKPTQYRNLLGTLKTSSPLKPRVDDLINLVQTGQKVKLPEGAQEPGALVQISANNATPDNKAIKVGAEIGGSTLTDQQATKMAVDNVLDNARDAYEKQVSTIVEAGKTKGGSISTADRAERFLQRARPDVVKNYEAAIEQDLEKTTGLNPEDASNIAGSIINPITGQREVSSVQKSGSKIAVKGATRSPFNERSIPNIDPETNQGTIKTAVGTAVRGRAPSYDQARFVERTREDINDPKGGTLPDIQGGISGPSAQELLERKSGELMQYTGKRPAGQEFTSETRLSPTTVPNTDIDPQTGKPKGGVKLGPLVETAGAKPLGERAPRTPVRRIISPAADQGDSGPGVGIYGEGTGYLPGPFSSTAEKAPTDTFGKTSPFKGVSDSTLTKLKSDMKPGTKSFESVDKEQRGRASMDAARELRKIQTSGDPSTSTERVAKFLDNLKKQQGG